MGMTARRRLIAGNWKMNGRLESAAALGAGLIEGLASRQDLQALDWLICPPFVHLKTLGDLLERSRQRLPGLAMKLGAQDLSAAGDGAYTGEISAEMLRDCGCSAVLIGHSERRQYFS
ncbi:MAG: triose-phosphate isomerase, partial [Betaproteobacteria bacterium]|nr:triose-phosphate isomerase [Betaproteobacteria bacterium]